jgi:TatD DNase family protein
MLIDTHSHIYSEEYNGEIDEVMNRAFQNGVGKIMLPNIDSSSIKKMLDLSSRYPGKCFPMMGIHPTSVKDDFEEELEVLNYWLYKRKFYGIGEIGIDFYWDDTYREEQEYVFKRQLKYAKQLKLPISIHTRDSFDVTFGILSQNEYNDVKGVFHCFTGTSEQAKAAIELGFKIGVGGIVTFKNSGIAEMVSSLSPNDLLLETDSPYLAPAPYRGKRNESGHLIHIAGKVAEIFGLQTEKIIEITGNNAEELFGI